MVRYFVITRFKTDFLSWCADNGVSRAEAQWVGHPHILKGLSLKKEQIFRCGEPPDLIDAINRCLVGVIG